MLEASYWIDKLALLAHPEGGYYKEIYRNTGFVATAKGSRNLSTSIYFLLDKDQKSHFHQLESDELWYFHAGSTCVLHIFDEEGYRSEKLGLDLEAGEQPQVILPRKCIFAAEVLDKFSYTLMGCVVSPGFDFQDFRLVSADELISRFPDFQQLIRSFTLS